MENQVNQLNAIIQNLARHLTQIDFERLDLDSANLIEHEGFAVQNEGAEIKLRSSRRRGELWAKKSLKEVKTDAERLQIPFKEAKRSLREANISEIDFETYLTQRHNKRQEITNASLARIGKKNNKKLPSVAGRILQKLQSWNGKPLLLEALVTKQCVGTDAEIQEVKELLQKLAVSFQDYANKI